MHRLLLCLILCCAMFATASGQSSDDALMTQAISAWQSQRARFESLRISTTSDVAIHGTRFPSRDGFEFLKANHTSTAELQFAIDLKKNRYRRNERREIFHIDERKYVPEVLHTLYNGKNFQMYYPREENVAVGANTTAYSTDLELRGDKPTYLIHGTDYPIFFWLGILPRSDFDLTTGNVSFPLERAKINKVDNSNATGSVYELEITDSNESKNVECYTLRSDFQVIRYASMHDGQTAYSLDIQYGQIESIECPIQWREKRYAVIDSQIELISDTNTKATSLQLNVADSVSFSVTPEPGMNIVDLTNDTRYRVPQPGQPLRTIAEIYAADIAAR